MKTNKTSKRALLTSVLSIALCLSMLIGTTFAWFTDTASTSVSKIVSGKLDIDLVDANNDTVTGRQLNWQTADKRAQSAILWEPGCTYNLEPVKLVNNGNLAAKCAVKITGVTGSNKLLEALDWTLNGEPMADQTIVLYPTTSEDRPSSLELNITASMKTTAGNEYQNLTLDGIAITVYATQANAENDSFGPDYDKDANGNPDHPDWDITANVTTPVAKDETGAVADTTVANADKTVEVTVPAAAIDPAAENIKLTVTPSSTPKVPVAPDQAVKAYEISVTGLAENNGTPVKVKLFVGKFLKNVSLAHNGTAMETSSYKYSQTTGYITFSTTSFSPFDVVYDAPQAINDAGEVTYDVLTNCYSSKYSSSSWTFLQDVKGSGKTISGANVSLDLDGHTLTIEGRKGFKVQYYYNRSASLTMKNGTYKANKFGASTTANFECYENSSITFENMEMETTASMVFPHGESSELNIINTNIKAGLYGVGTNASGPKNYNVKITIKDSTITTTSADGDNTAVYLNVPCTATIENSTITGDRQGMFVRGGTAVITNSTIATTGKFSDDKTYLDGYWGGGNELPCGALVLGNRYNSASYDYATDCTLNNVTLTAGNGVRTMYVYANAGEGIGTTLTYDAASKLGTIVYGTNENVTVNAPATE